MTELQHSPLTENECEEKRCLWYLKADNSPLKIDLIISLYHFIYQVTRVLDVAFFPFHRKQLNLHFNLAFMCIYKRFAFAVSWFACKAIQLIFGSRILMQLCH